MSGALLAAWINTNDPNVPTLPQEPAKWSGLVKLHTGCNIQPTFTNEYKPANYPTVKSLLDGLGFGLVRGIIPYSGPQAAQALAFYEELYTDLGIRPAWTAGAWVVGPLQGAAVNDADRLAIRAWLAGLTPTQKAMIAYLNNYNEPNGARTYNHVIGTEPGEDWWYDLSEVHQRFVWGVVNGGVAGVTQVPDLEHVIVGGPALHDHPPGRGLTSEQRLIDDCLKIGPGFANHRPYVLVINGHRYPAGGTPSNGIDQRTGWWQDGLGILPVLISETGYNHGLHTGFSQATPLSVIQKYADRMIAEHLSRLSGTSTPNVMIWFELLDNAPPASMERQNFYGIVTVGDTNNTATWATTGAYETLANHMALFDDATPSAPADIGLQITPGVGTSLADFSSLKYDVFGKSDGSYQIELWRDLKIWNQQTQVETDPPGVNIDVAFEGPQDLTVYRSSQQSAPIDTVTASNVTVSVDERMLVLNVAA